MAHRIKLKFVGYLIKQKIAKQWTQGELVTACGNATIANERALQMAIKLEYPNAKLTPQYDRS